MTLNNMFDLDRYCEVVDWGRAADRRYPTKDKPPNRFGLKFFRVSPSELGGHAVFQLHRAHPISVSIREAHSTCRLGTHRKQA